VACGVREQETKEVPFQAEDSSRFAAECINIVQAAKENG
jgi:hypothetical protein